MIERTAEFDHFALDVGDRLRRVLIAHHGADVGNDVTDEALAYAWEHWDTLRTMANPTRYLYRVANSAARRHRRWRRRPELPVERSQADEPLDPGLHHALARLSDAQRVCIVLVHVHDWTYEQAANATGMPVTAVTNHLHRGLRRLRKELRDTNG